MDVPEKPGQSKNPTMLSDSQDTLFFKPSSAIYPPSNPFCLSPSELSDFKNPFSPENQILFSTPSSVPQNNFLSNDQKLFTIPSDVNKPSSQTLPILHFKPTIHKEDTSKITIHNICGMYEYTNNCIEEIRYAYYQIQEKETQVESEQLNSESFREINSEFFFDQTNENNNKISLPKFIFVPNKSLTFKPTILKEDQLSINIFHICAMKESFDKSIEEIRHNFYLSKGKVQVLKKKKFKPISHREDKSYIQIMHVCAYPDLKNTSIEEIRLREIRQNQEKCKSLNKEQDQINPNVNNDDNLLKKEHQSLSHQFQPQFINLSKPLDSIVEKLPTSSFKIHKLVKLIITEEVVKPIHLLLSVEPGATINEIKLLVSEEFPDLKNFNLAYKSKILKSSEVLDLLKIPDNDEITIIKVQNQEINSHEKNKFLLKKIPIESLLPIIGNEYWTEPSIEEMGKMTVRDLKKIKNFTIVNDYEKLVFEGETNVIRLNLLEIVRVQKNSFVVYPDDLVNEKPEVGFELNKPAVLTLFNFQIDKPIEEFQKAAMTVFEKGNIEFLYYEKQSKELVVRIKHF
ncbi:hypothetical protein SteCoe_38758 [Stentor coeruleus]|uniref:Peptidase S59 domain-containing protein n=1 Tax=Stentor coeruleus TaxID=5963 RepID=A0A1R2AL29_9CILI|nr:hypothetical protein SteCoe_38758 [Stentor coeruleus]